MPLNPQLFSPLRKRHRQAIRPRFTWPVQNSRRERAASYSSSSQGQVIAIQPVKQWRKVEKGSPKNDQHESRRVNKKSLPNRPKTLKKAISENERVKGDSLSESELELWENDQVFDLSDEEEYSHVEPSPEPIVLSDGNGSDTNRERDHRDFWRSKSPTGLEFVTMRKRRGVAKNAKVRDATLHKGGFNQR